MDGCALLRMSLPVLIDLLRFFAPIYHIKKFMISYGYLHNIQLIYIYICMKITFFLTGQVGAKEHLK